jgi:hypothetical protein
MAIPPDALHVLLRIPHRAVAVQDIPGAVIFVYIYSLDRHKASVQRRKVLRSAAKGYFVAGAGHKVVNQFCFIDVITVVPDKLLIVISSDDNLLFHPKSLFPQAFRSSMISYITKP